MNFGMRAKAVVYGALALIVATGVPLVPIPSPPLGVRFASSHVSLVMGRRAGVGCMVAQGVSVPTGAPGAVSFPIAYNPLSCAVLVRVGILAASENQRTEADRDCYVLTLQNGKVAVTPPGYKCVKVVLPDGTTFVQNLANPAGK